MALLSSYDENDFRTLNLGQMYAGLISYEVLTGQKILNSSNTLSEVVVFNWSDGKNTYQSYLGGNDLSYSGMVDDTDDNGGSIIAFAQTQLSTHNGEYFTNFHYEDLTLNSEDFYHTLQTSTSLDEALLLKYELSGDDTLNSSNIVSSWKSVEIEGFEGGDTITGGAGGDILDGGKGADVINGGVGPDYIDGGWGNDTINLVSTKQYSTSYDAHNVSSSWQVGTNAKISLSGKTKFETVVDGGANIDTVNLSEQGDAYFLHDSFSNFNQSVTLTTDRYTGSSNTQRILNIENINGLGGDDIIDLTSPDYSLAGQVITIDGGEGNDIIWGSNSTETILGGAGNDILFGGVGADTLTGGLGADTFELTVTSDGVSITDYSQSDGDIIKIYRRADGEEASAEAAISGGILTFSGASVNLGSSSLNSISDINLEYATIAATASNVYDQAPVITSQMSRVVTAATENSEYKYYFSATASYSDDAITYSSTDKPSWLNFDTSTGLLSGTPNANAIGDHEVSLIATDTEGNQSTQAFTVSVRETDTAEVIPFSFESDLRYDSMLRTIGVFDFDKDGSQDVLLSYVSFSWNEENNFPKNTIAVIGNSNGVIKNIAPDIFDVVPQAQQAHQVVFEDLDLDGDLDLIMSEAGLDVPPWTGGDIVLSINNANGYENIIMPNELSGARAYAIATGDLDSDGIVELLIGDPYQVVFEKNFNGVSLNFNSKDDITYEINSTPNFQGYLNSSTFSSGDYDNDGKLDLFIGGIWSSPNHTIYFDGMNAIEATILPESIYGHKAWQEVYDTGGTYTGADVNAIVEGDFDNDGDIDIITISEEVIMTRVYGASENTDTVNNIINSAEDIIVEDGVDVSYGGSSITIIENSGGRNFATVTSESFSHNLGNRYYNSIKTSDINNDGLMDLLAHYWDKTDNKEWFTTLFINEGDLQFQKYDVDSFLGNYQNSGLIIPTGRYENNGAEVLIVKTSDFFSEPIIESHLSSIQISEDLSYIEFS